MTRSPFVLFVRFVLPAAVAWGIVAGLAGCAVPLRDPWGLNVARGEPVAPRLVPRFQADLEVLPRGPGALPFSARLYGETRRSGDSGEAPPPPRDSSAAGSSSRRYRLDVFGFPSSLAASWLWRDGSWLLVRHDRREAVTGTGALAIEGSPVRIPDVPAVLGVLAGEPLPGYPGSSEPSAEDGVVRWIADGEAWEARFDRLSGVCRQARSASLTLLYARHRAHDGVVIPGETFVLSGEDTLLVLKVRAWKASPSWKKDPFDLSVPPGYRQN